MKKQLLGFLFVFISSFSFAAEDSILFSIQIKRGYYFNRAELRSYSPLFGALPSVELIDSIGLLKIPKSIFSGIDRSIRI